MLLFTRRPGETVVIDGKVKVMILKTGAGKVSLGITAPKSVRVDRAEVHQSRLNGTESKKPLPTAALLGSFAK